MIFKIKGIIDSIQNGKIILDVNGIFYEILFSLNKMNELKLQEVQIIYITQIIKEEEHLMFGFLTIDEKIWFENLIKIDGLGPKTSMKLMSTVSIEAIQNAINNKDNKIFESISGIGSKIALRVVNEMQKKLKKINEEILIFNNENRLIYNDKNNSKFTINSNINLALQALQSLGFSSAIQNNLIQIEELLKNKGMINITPELIIQRFLQDR